MRCKGILVAASVAVGLALGQAPWVAAAKGARKKPPARRGAEKAPGGGKKKGQDKPAKKPAAPVVVNATVVATEFKFTPNHVTVPEGATLVLTLENKGTVTHNIALPAAGAKSATIRPGEMTTIVFQAKKAGRYAFACKVPGHEMVGMKGEVVVAARR